MFLVLTFAFNLQFAVPPEDNPSDDQANQIVLKTESKDLVRALVPQAAKRFGWGLLGLGTGVGTTYASHLILQDDIYMLALPLTVLNLVLAAGFVVNTIHAFEPLVAVGLSLPYFRRQELEFLYSKYFEGIMRIVENAKPNFLDRNLAPKASVSRLQLQIRTYSENFIEELPSHLKRHTREVQLRLIKFQEELNREILQFRRTQLPTSPQPDDCHSKIRALIERHSRDGVANPLG